MPGYTECSATFEDGPTFVPPTIGNQLKQRKLRESQQKASTAGQSGRRNPIPGIPNKQDQPANDIKQNKPCVRLTSRKKEGGPGSGPRKDEMSRKMIDQTERGLSQKGDVSKERSERNRQYKAPGLKNDPRTLSMMSSKRGKRASFNSRLAAFGK